ncbi:radical SAM protein [Thermococcus sp.]|uniref:radical SAM protein n=1 Tax=Thermococcus sp. TaxID=35749 RepID=UPI00260433FC|nr:radical SAM protein [Thermococcus sp.]
MREMHPLTLSFFITYKCNYNCAHCSLSANSKKDIELPISVIRRFLEEGKKLGFRVAVFTGGEPTLKWDKLLKSIQYAKDLGYATRVVSNGWWGFSYENAYKMLFQMKKSGLDEVNISFDDYHVSSFRQLWKMEPLYVLHIAKASLDLNLRLGIAVIEYENSIITREFITKLLSWYLGRSYETIKENVVIVNDVPARAGRGKELPNEILPERELPVSGCEDIGTTYGIHPDGRITVCCGHAIFESNAYDIGNWKENGITLKEAINNTSKNIIYWWLYAQGPKRILKKLGINEKTTHICDACKILMVDHKDELLEYIKHHRDEILVNDVLLNTRAQELVKFVKEKRRATA